MGKIRILIWSNGGNCILIGKRYCFFNRKTGKRFLKLFTLLFEALVAPDRGFYGVSYDEEVKIFKDYIAPTDLTVKIKR